MSRSAPFVLLAAVLLSASVSSQGRGQEQPYPRLPAPAVKSS